MRQEIKRVNVWLGNVCQLDHCNTFCEICCLFPVETGSMILLGVTELEFTSLLTLHSNVPLSS